MVYSQESQVTGRAHSAAAAQVAICAALVES
jgi:hypothetical protein